MHKEAECEFCPDIFHPAKEKLLSLIRTDALVEQVLIYKERDGAILWKI